MNKNYSPVVFMYHGVIAENAHIPEGREPGADLYDIQVKAFEEQLKCLSQKGYRATVIEETIEHPEKNITLTFDDGELNNFTCAFPILKQSGFPAYFFVTINRIGKKGYMGWEELKELRDSGMIIGSHGVNHLILTELTDKRIEEELVTSKDVLEQHLKVNVDYFSVPRGFYNERVQQLALKSGYNKILVSTPPKEPSSFCIGRLAVKSNWNISRFSQATSGETPVEEKITHSLKSVMKNMLGTKVYDHFRTRLLRK